MKKLLNKLEANEALTMSELKEIAYYEFNLNEYDWDYVVKVRDNIFDILDSNGKDWDNCDEDYPNNPYYVGYELDGEIFITGYTGVAGHHWDEPNTYRICY